MIKRILFDLDGTVINSQKGITLSAQYALEKFGISEPDAGKLTFFIGPPLEHTFMTHYDFTKDSAREAVMKYRERYLDKGLYECELYPGVRETLVNLKDKGYELGIASSKPESSCKIILEYLGVEKLFDDICGACEEEKRSAKKDVLIECMRRAGTESPTECILVGDTAFDVNGAKEVGMDCVAVAFGFGNIDEMIAAGACMVCSSMKEVNDYFEQK